MKLEAGLGALGDGAALGPESLAKWVEEEVARSTRQWQPIRPKGSSGVCRHPWKSSIVSLCPALVSGFVCMGQVDANVSEMLGVLQHVLTITQSVGSAQH